MSENSTCLGSGQGVPGRTPINNAYWRFRLVWQAKPSQYEPETGGHPGDVR
jgi:hypothetical protein